MNSRFLISAPHSGSGKTIVALGLLRAFRNKGYTVQPFKCGPDYIDPIHHRTAAGRDSFNLDRFMMSDSHISDVYEQHAAGADIAITEGVMGLFDGATKDEGSSADIARLLDIPVLLVLDAKAMAYSAAALLYGLKNFDTRLKIAGVIFNFVDHPAHYRLLVEACHDVGIQPLGYLSDNENMRIPERHLGLDTANAEAAIEAAAGHIGKCIDLDALLAATKSLPLPPQKKIPTPIPQKRILIARDEAFHFLYPENIRRLSQWGQITYFSPVHDNQLPFRPDLLYLPGGYPELYLQQLTANRDMLRQIGTYANTDGRIIAECGGMMYLGRSIVDDKGQEYPMAGVLDIITSMTHPRLTIGYRTIRAGSTAIKGHEFHFSQPLGEWSATNIAITNAHGEPALTPFFYSENLLASYAHFYWGENMDLLNSGVCRQ
ncbi:MAG: cobyrinate a,c-diamide synthase [Bacteroidetes bacterium]|nr:cobyrinate a,c-diamide synthase [Bacteroidota bacterium]